MKKALLAVLPILILSCSTVRVHTSNPALLSPITAPNEKINFSLEMGSSDIVKFTEDASARPPVIAAENSPSNDARFNVLYGVNDSFDFSAGVNNSAGLNLHSRLRLIGDKKSVGSLILAGTFFYSYDGTTKSGDQNGEFGPGGYNWKAEANSTLSSLGLSIGYRPSENILVYIHGGAGNTTAKMDITQEPGGSDPGGSYSYSEKAPLRHIGFGMTYGQNTLVTVGAMYTHKEWTDIALGDTSTTHAILKIESN